MLVDFIPGNPLLCAAYWMTTDSYSQSIDCEYDYDYEEEVEEERGGLVVGGWMEGDSLAPPCQADKDVVEAILSFANEMGGGITPQDTIFDLGIAAALVITITALYRGDSFLTQGVAMEEYAVKLRGGTDAELSGWRLKPLS